MGIAGAGKLRPGLAHVRPLLEQARGQTGRHGGRDDLRAERTSARDRGGRPSEKDTDHVLGLFDLALEIGDGLGGRGDEDLRLAHVDEAGHPAALAQVHELQRSPPRGQGPAGDVELLVERTEPDVGRPQIRHQGHDDEPSEVFRPEHLGARGLGVPAEAAPEIDLE